MDDVILDEANQVFHKPPLGKLKLEAMVDSRPPSPSPSPVEEEKEDEVYFSDEDDMSPADYALYCSQTNESCGFDVDFFKHTLNGIFPGGWNCLDIILAKTGLHCYNIEKVIDPVDSSLHTFQTLVTDGGKENKARMILKSRICRIKSQVPGKGDANAFWDYDAIDAFYKGDLPDWPLDDALTGGGFYEVKESELRDHEFYAEVAMYSEWSCDMDAYLPFKMNKVVV